MRALCYPGCENERVCADLSPADACLSGLPADKTLGLMDGGERWPTALCPSDSEKAERLPCSGLLVCSAESLGHSAPQRTEWGELG